MGRNGPADLDASQHRGMLLDWFRAQGRGYQMRINAILRKYFEQHTR